MGSLKLIFEFLPTPEVTLLHTLRTFNSNTQEVSGLQLEKTSLLSRLVVHGVSQLKASKMFCRM